MRRVIGIALLIGAVAVLGWFIFLRQGGSTQANGASHSGRHRGDGSSDGTGEDGPVPVTIVDVKRQDVPIYLDGIGTVQAFNTVTVRPQVDGQLLSVAFTEGQDVKTGDLLAQIDPRPFQATLDQAQAKTLQDQSLLATASRDLERYQGLVADNYVSKQQVDTQRQSVKQAEATVKADQAAAQNARISLGFARIASPINGVTGIRQVDVGNLVQAASSTGLVVVTQVQPISVVFTLPEQTLSDIRAAGTEKLGVIALDRNNKNSLGQGELTVIDNQIDQTTGTIKLKATFANKDKTLWPGQFVNVRLLVRTEKNGIVVPAGAVQRGPSGDFIYVAKSGEASKQDVTVARTEAGVSLISKGINDGDRIVTDGQYRLQPGSKIREATDIPAAPQDAPASTADGATTGGDAASTQHELKHRQGSGQGQGTDGSTTPPSAPTVPPSGSPAPAPAPSPSS